MSSPNVTGCFWIAQTGQNGRLMKSLIPEEKYILTFVDFFLFLDPLDETLYASSYMPVSGLCFFIKNMMKTGLKWDKRWGVG
jgi:hypothetical protein